MMKNKQSDVKGVDVTYQISMDIKEVMFVRENNLEANECIEVVVKFVCETPLNEFDTCTMINLYFDDVYFDVSDDDTFIKKGNVYEMGGIIIADPSEKSLALTVGKCIIPITDNMIDELKTGVYNADPAYFDVKKVVKNRFGDLFDKDGNLIIADEFIGDSVGFK